MAKTDCLATADNDSTTKEQLERKELIIDIPPQELDFPLPECCIYRVPKRLREVKKRAYTPRLVSIGPFHYYLRKELKEMERQKERYMRDFQNRTKKSREDLARIIKPYVHKIRKYYSEPFSLRDERFVNMIVLDAIFILELFRMESENVDQAHDQKDYILSRPCMKRGIQHDLLLLENQLPFFVLEKLYEYVEPNTERKTLLELSCWFFGDLYYGWKPEPPDPKNNKENHITDLVNRFRQEPRSPNHFTDLVRYFFCPPKNEGQNSKKCGLVKQCFPNWVGCCCHPKPSSPEPGPGSESESKHCTDLVKRTKPLYTATKLDEAGLKITRPDSKRHLLQIQFREKNCECFIKRCPVLNLSWLLSCLPCLKRTCLVHMQRFLEVPPLRVDDKTEGLFRNLMALEQCHYPEKTYICDYIVLLDDLITTKADVRLLVEKKIIVNELGSSAAVTKLFNNLGLEIEESGSHYVKLCEKLNEYYESNRNRLVGTLANVYFSDFFKGTATVAGIIVLVLTLWNFHRLLRLRWSDGPAGKY